jgi:GNAT superfamily N-acetyltransferase
LPPQSNSLALKKKTHPLWVNTKQHLATTPTTIKTKKMSSKYYDLKYRFSSQLDDMEGDRYITTYKAKIYETDLDRSKKSLIGKFTLKHILVGLAINEGYPLDEVIDREEYTSQIGEDIFDLETNDLKEDIQEFYDYGLGHNDICLLARIEIQESHRGKGIGRKVIKDVYNRFNTSCGLFVVQAFPLQFEKKSKNEGQGELSKWSKKMKLSSLENDYEKAFYQLKSFYQKIGFDHIEGYDELMFLNMELRNEKMDKVRLE